ncbi:DnaJ like chaperone protein [Nitrosomonas marina]|uniref:DnaJ like chaperone protein n=1 Tax=Nitrosomonas marina TaxID=917 RepID=A0A1I0BDC6_9PROT|nr:co-chaperone DjlA [Nitrosomonas marina]SET04832.1 DnaJ like chaperone protein [Nitrosomonas marina]
MFKFLGAIAGFFVLGILGSMLGFLVGSIIDRFKSPGAGGMNFISPARRQSVFLETVFVLMGKLAKVDGRVSENEVAHVEQFMRQLGMTSDHRLKAIALFKRGATPMFDIKPKLAEFMAVCGSSGNLRQMLLVYLISVGLSDGQLNTAESRLLKEIAGRLGYSKAAYDRLLEMVINQTRFAGGQSVTSGDALEEAYKALGVGRRSSDQEIKRAYRKLMSQYHPDKLTGQGLPEEMVSVATEQAKEIQTAYDLIKKHRAQHHSTT